jgi:CheY-like chemotaxis protein
MPALSEQSTQRDELLTLRMLVADDSRVVHTVFRDAALKASVPIELITANDGKQCLEQLASGSIDLAFIDVHMPQMSGIEAVSAMQAGGRKTFVTLMSADATMRNLPLVRELRVYGFLNKPFQITDVVSIINNYVRVASPARILIVDDSATVRKIIRRVVEGSIFRTECKEVADGQEALTCCEHEQFDVIFLDLNMPGLNGFETFDHLKTASADLKVVLMSGEKDPKHAQRAFDSGAVAFLSKPFFPADIDRVMHAAFGLHMPA